MLNEYVKFTKNQPLTGVVIGVSLLYAANTVRNAIMKPKGEFWNQSDGSLGASTSTTSSTSSSHAMMLREPAGDLIKHPTALYGYKDMSGHCTNPGCNTRTNPHCHCGGAGLAGGMSTTTSTSSAHAHKRTSNYGEDTYKSPLTLMGVPSHIKRRIGNAEDTESYQPTNPVVPEVETVESTLGWI